jgi:hypothetical protein
VFFDARETRLLSRLRLKLTYANVVSTLCLFILLGGSSYAAIRLGKNAVKGKNIAANAVTSPKVKNGSLLAQDFKAGQLPRGPQGPQGAKGDVGPASGAAGGDLAGSYPNPRLAPAEDWHQVSSFGTCTPSMGGAAWANSGTTISTVAYYRDPLGVVHVKGSVKCPGTMGATPVPIFTLPAGYRPDAVRYFAAVQNFGSEDGALAVVGFGNVDNLRASSATSHPETHLSLDAINFRCAPSGIDGCP